MNSNGYYQNPIFPGTGLNNNTVPNQQSVPSYESSQVEIYPTNMEQSYIENILRFNKGKKITAYTSFPSSHAITGAFAAFPISSDNGGTVETATPL